MLTFIVAASLAGSIASAAATEACRVAVIAPDGTASYPEISLDLTASTRLDREALPPGTSAMMCRRSTLVPQADDIRVLSELGVAFGIVAQGPRVLWISIRAGMVEVMVEHGRLNPSERAAVNSWRSDAQRRFLLAVAAASADRGSARR